MSRNKTIANQVFLGFPWSTTMRKYQTCCQRLRNESPLSFIIVGVDDDQSVEDLFKRIKRKLESSSYAIFDATGNNANVALEFGMAEIMGIKRALYYNPNQRVQNQRAKRRIMADLAGLTRNEYKTSKELLALLRTFSREHPFTKRFERLFTGGNTPNMRNRRARERRIALRLIRRLDNQPDIKKGELITSCSNGRYGRNEVERMLNRLVRHNIIKSGKTRSSKVSIYPI